MGTERLFQRNGAAGRVRELEAEGHAFRDQVKETAGGSEKWLGRWEVVDIPNLFAYDATDFSGGLPYFSLRR